MPPKHPDPLLEVRCSHLSIPPELLAFCAGYELGEWREKQLAKHIIKWLPEFALSYSEWQELGAHNAAELLGKAAASIYTSERYRKRGEFGEILLHIMIRQAFASVPAISKYYFKDSSNDTVKGFDAVHVVEAGDQFELWLGESKFYEDIGGAIAAAVASLSEHMERDYLRSEFIAITNKLDRSWGKAAEVSRLLHENTSLDKIFKSVCIPVLLTYDSPTVAAHHDLTAKYIEEFKQEVLLHRDSFASKSLPTNVTVRLFLLPLRQKAELVRLMDEALKACQAAL